MTTRASPKNAGDLSNLNESYEISARSEQDEKQTSLLLELRRVLEEKDRQLKNDLVAVEDLLNHRAI